MAEPYRSLREQAAALLLLADQCLAPLEGETPLPPEERASGQLQARRAEELDRRRCEATVAAGGAAPLEYLFRTFELTGFERRCVRLALAAELDSSFEDRFATLQRDNCRLPSLELCLRTFTVDPAERAGLLAQWRTRVERLDFFFRGGHRGVDLQSDLTPGLKLDRRIADYALDFTAAEPRLEGKAELRWPGGDAPEPLVFREELCGRMLDYAAGLAGPPLFFLRGEEGAGRRTLARRFCRARGLVLLEADLPALLEDGGDWEGALLPLLREAAIHRAALALHGFEILLEPEEAPVRDEEDGEPAGGPAARRSHRRAWIRLLLDRAAAVAPALFLLSRRPWPPGLDAGPWHRVELDLEQPDAGKRILLWRRYLAETALDPDIDLEVLAVKFALQPGQIAAAAREAGRLARWAGAETVSDEILHRACRAQLSHELGKKASRVNAAYTWDDLILPPLQKRQLQNACDQVTYRHRIYDQWGFGAKVAYGRGLSMLFTGPPGTGKTMAAQVIAGKLRLELYKVDLSGVMSKYIGETEKNLGAIFEEVKKSQSILFFDEADAMFGKRSETKDAQDRYANVQTSYLLQKMEEYEGIVILASNFLQNFDEAFKRRIKFIIDFPLPDREYREQIWRSVFPPAMPRHEDVDFDFLARSFELSGSSIKNIAVSAAFLAAAEDSPVGMVHLLQAARTELHKVGKSLGREELGEYYHLLRQGEETNTCF